MNGYAVGSWVRLSCSRRGLSGEEKAIEVSPAPSVRGIKFLWHDYGIEKYRGEFNDFKTVINISD